ncbi:MAG TPA: Holliday junction branch migration protein RuvA [Alphaproteobacteria bacterium]|jgi:holliday junction DNA helicase RuvA|nr:Holliday junction branch migration protein RuvA [Alphaproteobacteria bacterium]
MIAKLRGILDSTGEDWAILDVGGVGYLVYCSARTLARLPEPGSAVALEIETHVREDHIHLYGFSGPSERAWFRLLTTVQGVGARVAMAVQGVLGPDELAQAVAMGDRAGLTRAPGVGPKLAQRIVAELKDKVDAIAVQPIPVRLAAMNGDHATDAVSALVNLGYRRPEAVGAVSAAVRSLGAEAAVEALIKAGLKELAR